MSRREVVFFLLVWGCAWSLVTCLLDPTVPYDAVEALNWAQNAEWGSPKNPWLPGVMMMPVAGLGGVARSIWWYVSHFGAAVTGLAGVVCLARVMNPDRRLAALAPLSLMVSGVACVDLVPYNDNYLLVMLWPWVLYFCYQALARGPVWWPAFALAAGLACMAKYSTFALVAGVFVITLAVRTYRRVYREPLFWLALGLFLLLVVPNLLWLQAHHFAAFRWVGSQISTQANLRLPLIILSVFYPLLILAGGLRGSGAGWRCPRATARRAVLFVYGAPLGMILVWFAFHHGGRLTEWLQPFVVPAPALLLSMVRLPAGRSVRRMSRLYGLAGGVMLAGYVAVMTLNIRQAGEKFSGIKPFSEAVLQAWQSRYPVPLRYVGGEWLSQWLLFYLPGAPHTLMPWSAETTPNIYNRDITAAQLRRAGGVVVGEEGQACPHARFPAFRRNWPDIIPEVEVTLYFRRAPSAREVPVCVAFIAPQQEGPGAP